MLPWLDDDHPVFPDISTALDDPDGLLAAGGNLHCKTLINAYSRGIFPWYCDPDPILWWSPNPRCMLKPQDVHISKSMKKLLHKKHYQLSWNTAFTEVITACSQPRNYTAETWISQDIINAYIKLHQQGLAHSVEVWQDNELVGGLYGIAIGSAFFGESMFAKASNSSKYAFIHLCQQLAASGFKLIDCQVESEHLLSLGAYTIPRSEFSQQLKEAIATPPISKPWEASTDNE